MATFTIIVTRDITESLVIEVEAFDEEAACQYVHHSAVADLESNAKDGATWTVDDAVNNNDEVYITDITEEAVANEPCTG